MRVNRPDVMVAEWIGVLCLATDPTRVPTQRPNIGQLQQALRSHAVSLTPRWRTNEVAPILMRGSWATLNSAVLLKGMFCAPRLDSTVGNTSAHSSRDDQIVQVKGGDKGREKE